MEFLIISPTKMKVKLSDDEIKKYSLSDIESERVDVGMRKGLWQLMDIAKARCGFSSGGEKLLVQFYRSDLGGELFVTKLLSRSPRAEKLLEGAANITLLREYTSVFRFRDADSLICALLACGSIGALDAQLYLSDDGCYYLISKCRDDGTSDIFFLAEYGDEVPEVLLPVILEHSRLLGEGEALSKFSS